jgi:hypothetical protein
MTLLCSEYFFQASMEIMYKTNRKKSSMTRHLPVSLVGQRGTRCRYSLTPSDLCYRLPPTKVAAILTLRHHRSVVNCLVGCSFFENGGRIPQHFVEREPTTTTSLPRVAVAGVPP